MQPRINVITIGVEDIRKSRKFYEDLGFIASSTSNEHFVAFQAGGIILCLYPTRSLAEDARIEPNGKGFRGVTLAYNVEEKNEVTHILEQAERFGAKIMKPAQDVFWGGHSGYFADPDGHLWEVAWNPHWSLEKDGTLRLPK